jgi:hypothetical protein
VAGALLVRYCLVLLCSKLSARRHAPENTIRSLEQVPNFGDLFPMITTPDRVYRRPIHENGGAVVVFSASGRLFGSADFNARVNRHFLLVRSLPWSGELNAAFRVVQSHRKAAAGGFARSIKPGLQRHRPLLSLP